MASGDTRWALECWVPVIVYVDTETRTVEKVVVDDEANLLPDAALVKWVGDEDGSHHWVTESPEPWLTDDDLGAIEDEVKDVAEAAVWPAWEFGW